MDTLIAQSNLPFRFQGREYRILRTGIRAGLAYAAIEPENKERGEHAHRDHRKHSMTIVRNA